MEILIWLAMASVSAYIAGEKGRSIGGWFLLGLLLPLLSIILLIVLPPLKYSEATGRMEPEGVSAAGKYRKCPFCAEMVLKEAIKCKHCQSDITAEPKES